MYENEDPVAKNNRCLGEFVLNVASMNKGEPEIQSTTVVDDEGIVKVKAVCLIDGAENSIVIDTYKGRMTKEEIEEHLVIHAKFNDNFVIGSRMSVLMPLVHRS